MRTFLRIAMVSMIIAIVGVSVGCGSNSPTTKDAGKEMMKDDKMKGEGMMKDDKMKGEGMMKDDKMRGEGMMKDDKMKSGSGK